MKRVRVDGAEGKEDHTAQDLPVLNPYGGPVPLSSGCHVELMCPTRISEALLRYVAKHVSPVSLMADYGGDGDEGSGADNDPGDDDAKADEGAEFSLGHGEFDVQHESYTFTVHVMVRRRAFAPACAPRPPGARACAPRPPTCLPASRLGGAGLGPGDQGFAADVARAVARHRRQRGEGRDAALSREGGDRGGGEPQGAHRVLRLPQRLRPLAQGEVAAQALARLDHPAGGGARQARRRRAQVSGRGVEGVVHEALHPVQAHLPAPRPARLRQVLAHLRHRLRV